MMLAPSPLNLTVECYRLTITNSRIFTRFDGFMIMQLTYDVQQQINVMIFLILFF